MLYRLSDAPVDPAAIGAAGVNLAWLSAQGFPVAPTWVLDATTFDAALPAAGAADAAAEIAWNLKGVWNDLDAAQRVLEGVESLRRRVARALRQATLPDDLGRAMERLALMETPWLLRAAPTGEESAVFAGLFPVLLGIPGRALWDGICQIWAAAFSQRVLARVAEMETGTPRLAVLIQAVPAIGAKDRSGVAGDSSVRALFGAWQDGAGALYRRACGCWVVIPARSKHPPYALVSKEGGGLERVPYPDDDPLRAEEARRIGEMAERAAELAGAPVQLDFFWSDCQAEPLIVEMRE